jgi:hypothetical protein
MNILAHPQTAITAKCPVMSIKAPIVITVIPPEVVTNDECEKNILSDE